MYKITFLISILFLFISCSSEDDKTKEKETSIEKPVTTDLSMQNSAVSFISNQEDVIMYGSIKLNQLLNKAYYDSDIAKSDLFSSAFVEQAIEEIERIKSYLNVGIPIYYAMKSSENIDDMELIVFGGINDKEAIIKEIISNKSTLSKKDHKSFTLIQEPGVSMALTKNKFIFRISSNLREKNLPKIFDTYFNSFNGKKDLTVQTVFNKSKDVNITYDYGKIMKLYQATIQSISGVDMDYLKNMDWMSDIDMTTSMDLAFENGSISMLMNIYSDEMKEWNLFSTSSKEILPKLGQGKPLAGFLANLNIDEYQKLWKEYYPDGIINQIMDMDLGPEFEAQIPPELAAIEATLMKDGLKSFFGGEIGMMLYNMPNKSRKPEMSIYMNIGSNLKAIIDDTGIPEIPGGDLNIDIKDDHISMHSKNHTPDGKGPELSGKFSNFGKAPISAFLDLAQIPTNDLPNEFSDFESLIEMLDFIDMEFDMSGGHVTLHFKDKSKNGLTQIADVAVDIGTLILREMTGLSL